MKNISLFKKDFSLFRLIKGRLLVLVLTFFLLIGITFEQISRSNSNVRYPPKGLLIDIGSRVIHLDCRRTGNPTIVLESGLDTLGSLSWSKVHDELAKDTRTCAYDRAGIMWSDKRLDENSSLNSIAKDLNKALNAAKIQPPFILVGHSYGGPYITKFKELYPKSVAGAVFIDSPHPEQMKLVKDIDVPVSVLIQKYIHEFLSPAFDFTGITRMSNSFNSNILPNQTQNEVDAINAFFQSSNSALSYEIENYSKGLEELNHIRYFGDRPLFILANIVNYRKMSDEQLIAAGINRELVDAVMKQDLYMFNDQASWSSQGKLKLLHDTSHYIQFHKPSEVISAVKWVLENIEKS